MKNSARLTCGCLSMNRIAALLALFVPVLAFGQFRGYEELYDSETVRSLKEQVEYLSSAALEGRGAGTEGEAEAAVYVARTLASYGIDLITPEEGDPFGIKGENGDTLTSRNVAGVISGYDKSLKDSYIVIGARLDNLGTTFFNVDGEKVRRTYYGANGNASGLATMLHLASRLSANRALLKRSVIFVAFGASEITNAGSWYFLNRSFKHTESIDAMINLDMLGSGSRGFYAYTSSNPDMNNRLAALASTLQPVQPEVVGIEPVRSDHRTFYGFGIPSVFFTTGMYPEYNTENDTAHTLDYDWMERQLEYLYNFTISLANGARPEFEASATAKKADAPHTYAFADCDVTPQFLGSPDPGMFLKKWVYTYLKYPQECIEDGIQGKVLVDFVIDEKGKVREVKVRKGVHPLLDAEAKKVVESSPDWKPARKQGKKVRCGMSVYVEFRLKKK